MTQAPMAGTFQLDGLLEGPLFGSEDSDYLEQFVEQLTQEQFHFNLSQQFNRFSLLGEPSPQSIPADSVSITPRITHHFDRLLNRYTLEQRRQFTSTVRSIEFTPGQETQTLYLIGLDGQIHPEQRTLPRTTRTAKRRLTLTQWIIAGLVTASVLGILIWTQALDPIIQWTTDQCLPQDPGNLEVINDDFNDLFTIKSLTYEDQSRSLVITCEILPGFPTTPDEINQAWQQNQNSVYTHLTYEALARQRIQCLIYSGPNTTLRHWTAPMIWKESNEHLFTLTLPILPNTQVIQLTY